MIVVNLKAKKAAKNYTLLRRRLNRHYLSVIYSYLPLK